MANWGLLDGLGKGLLMVGENALKRKNLDYEMKIREAYEQGMERLRHSNNLQLVGEEAKNRAGLLAAEHQNRMIAQNDEQAARMTESGTNYDRELSLIGARGSQDRETLQFKIDNGVDIGDGNGDTRGDKNLRALLNSKTRQLEAALGATIQDEDQIAKLQGDVAKIEARLIGGQDSGPPAGLTDEQMATFERGMAQARLKYPNAPEDELRQAVLEKMPRGLTGDTASPAKVEPPSSQSAPTETPRPSVASESSRAVELTTQKPKPYDPASAFGADKSRDEQNIREFKGMLSAAGDSVVGGLKGADTRSLLGRVKERIGRGVKPTKGELNSFRQNMRYLSEEEQAEVRSIIAWAESE